MIIGPLLKFHGTRDILLGRGEVDLQISTVRSTDPTVQWRQLIVEPLRLAVPSGHRLARRALIPLAEVSSEPFIMLRPASLLRSGSTRSGRFGFPLGEGPARADPHEPP